MKKTLIHGLALTALFSLGFTQAHAQTTADTSGVQAGSTPSADQNQQAGQKYMEENKNKPGVVTLPSGLQYKIEKAGTGKKPGANDTVTVSYKGTLLNGKVFDQSKPNQPISFPVSGVIAGWQEALQLMNEGSTWMLYIPPNLAYGSAGAGGVIGPNETLIFEVTLLKVQ